MSDFRLTKEQSKHLKSVKWLISDLCQVGKTTVLAVAFIEKALESPDRWIPVFDHHQSPMRKRDILGVILAIANKVGLQDRIQVGDLGIRGKGDAMECDKRCLHREDPTTANCVSCEGRATSTGNDRGANLDPEAMAFILVAHEKLIERLMKENETLHASLENYKVCFFQMSMPYGPVQ